MRYQVIQKEKRERLKAEQEEMQRKAKELEMKRRTRYNYNLSRQREAEMLISPQKSSYFEKNKSKPNGVERAREERAASNLTEDFMKE